MQRLKNELYDVTISYGPVYHCNSADNYPYDEVIILEKSRHYQTLKIEIKSKNTEREIAVVAPYLSSATCERAILENNTIVMLLDCLIIRLDLDTLKIISRTELETSTISLYQHNDGYIIHGETKIIMLDTNLMIQWRFSGRDIFVRPDDKDQPAFSIKNDRICLYDFEDHHYEIDFNGQLIKDHI